MEKTLSVARNTANLLLAVVVPLPSIIFYNAFLKSCSPISSSSHNSKLFQHICNMGINHPLALLNLLFFLNVDILFWLISLLQGSTWLIDLYWTILPLLMAHYFWAHPASKNGSWRCKLVMGLTWIWSIRLTHSYFRRERWQFGAREDWRYAKMRKDNPKHWWWLSFFAVYLSQQVFLVGICLPIYSVFKSEAPCKIYDILAFLACISGIAVAYVADTQIYEFTSKKKIKKGKSSPILDYGLWHYSRHPNYFGEQLWWWGLAFFSWSVGESWTIVGTILNSACLAAVTVMVEKKMLEDQSRAETYRKYQNTTSVWVPWMKFKG